MKKIFTYYVFLILIWILAWVLFERTEVGELSSNAQFIYWTIAKLIIWILPVILIVKFYLKKPIADYLGFHNLTKGIKVGTVYGLVFVCLSFLFDYFNKSFGWPQMSAALINVIVISPLFEETVFRGFVLGTLEKSGTGFWTGNIIAACMFLGLHIPGWYFMGVLSSQGIVMFSIVLIGLIAGYAKRKSDSTWASVSVHFVNNLYSTFLR